jgi:hypothetical protein
MSDPSDNGAPFERDADNRLSQRVILKKDGNAGQAHSRYLVTAGSTLATDIATATWGADEKVTAFRIKAEGAANMVRFVLDASPVDDETDTTQAEAWLTPVAAAAFMDTDVEYFEHNAAAKEVALWSDWQPLGGYLRRLDCIAVDDTTLNVSIEVA